MKLSTGETCRRCKPDTGACAAHLHLDPCYQANVVKPQARRAIKCLDQNCDFHPKDLTAAMKKQEAVKPSPSWYATTSAGGHQGMIADEKDPTGRTFALTYDPKDAEPLARIMNAHAVLVEALLDIRLNTTDGNSVAVARAALRAAGEAV